MPRGLMNNLEGEVADEELRERALGNNICLKNWKIVSFHKKPHPGGAFLSPSILFYD